MARRASKQEAGEELVKHDIITRQELTEAKEREKTSGTPWYRQLIQMKKMNLSMFDDVLRYEFHSKSEREEHQSLGESLLELNAISEDQLEEALTEQKRNGRLLGNILLDWGFVTRQTIAIALSKQYGLEYSELEQTPSDPDALAAVPESMARKNQMIPVRLDGDRLTVLISTPQARDVLKDVGILLGIRIYPVLTTTDDIRAEVAERYSALSKKAGRAKKSAATAETKEAAAKPAKKKAAKKKAAKAKKTVTTEEIVTVPKEIEMEIEEEEESDAAERFEEIAREASGVPVIKLVTTIIEGAANSGATDVHLDPQEPEMRVRYRIDGVLHDVMSIPPEIESAVISRVKILADIDITETRHPQDGHISMEIGEQEYDVRVATMPTYLGERVVLRLLDQSAVLAGIKDLGLEPEDEKKVATMISQPYGMILVTGPTGSGKTTSLYAALNQKNVITDSIVTLEDPVEYQLSGINQVQIDNDIDLTFARTLRAALRQDIDVLLVGEIRDPETAQIAIRAAMTGHLVFSTLHTNDAPEAISTLRNMDVPAYLIASALTAIVAQRLVRKICNNCKTSYKPEKSVLKTVGLPESTKRLYKGKGCELCYQTGIKGRTGVFEILEISPNVRQMITDNVPVEQISKSVKLKTMADRCRLKLKRGEMTAEEYVRVIRA